MTKPLLCGLFNGEYRWFLRSEGTKQDGEWLNREKYLERYNFLYPPTELPRCADPRCNRVFDRHRDDQIYCDLKCNKRHHSRSAYQMENGIAPDAPVKRTDDLSSRDAQIIEQLEAARRRYDVMPNKPLPREVISYDPVTGAPMLRMQSAIKRRLDERAKRTPRGRFFWDLVHAGLSYTDDFQWDTALVCEEWWKAHNETLPPLAEMIGDPHHWVDMDNYRMRLTKVEEKRRAEAERIAEAQLRAKQLSPLTMDQAAGDVPIIQGSNIDVLG